MRAQTFTVAAETFKRSSDLVPGQHASRSESLIPGAEVVAVSEVLHDADAETAGPCLRHSRVAFSIVAIVPSVCWSRS